MLGFAKVETKCSVKANTPSASSSTVLTNLAFSLLRFLYSIFLEMSPGALRAAGTPWWSSRYDCIRKKQRSNNQQKESTEDVCFGCHCVDFVDVILWQLATYSTIISTCCYFVTLPSLVAGEQTVGTSESDESYWIIHPIVHIYFVRSNACHNITLPWRLLIGSSPIIMSYHSPLRYLESHDYILY